MEKETIELPVCKGVYQVIFEGKALKQFFAELVAQPLAQENCL